MSSGNAVVIAFACRDPAAAGLLELATDRMARAGAQVLAPSPHAPDTALVYRFDGQTGALLMEAARTLRLGPLQALGGGAAMAVKVIDGAGLKPSELSAQMARTLAREAPPGRLALALRLGTLLGLTETAFSALLKPVDLTAADGTRRAAMLLEVDAGAPATMDTANGAASLATLDPARRARLVDQLAARLVDDLGPIAPILVARVCDDAETSADIVVGLRPYVSARAAARLNEVVAEELRLLFLRAR